MSLNREQWLTMWSCAKSLERISNDLTRTNAIRARQIDDEVQTIKELIQSVVGQLE